MELFDLVRVADEKQPRGHGNYVKDLRLEPVDDALVLILDDHGGLTDEVAREAADKVVGGYLYDQVLSLFEAYDRAL